LLRHDLYSPLTIFVVATINTRAKDSDRNDTCQVLDTALSEGQLSMEEHRQRVSSATNAATLGDLRSLVSDLQTSNAPVQLPKLKASRNIPQAGGGSGWGMRLAVAGVLVALGIGIGWGIFGSNSPLGGSAEDPGAKPDGISPLVLNPPKQLHSLNGLNGLLETARKQFGDTMAYRLIVYPDYAVMDRADPNDNRRELDYNYRGGWGNPSSSAKSADARIVDVGKFDVPAVVAVMRGAPETLNIKPGDVKSMYLIIDPTRDPTRPNTVDVSIHVSSDYGSGNIELDPAGNVLQISRPNS
jgi:hypothetical protein